MNIGNRFNDVENFGSERFQKSIDELREELKNRRLYGLKFYGSKSPEDDVVNNRIVSGIMSTVAPLKSLSSAIQLGIDISNNQLFESKLVHDGAIQYSLHMLYNTTNQLTSRVSPTLNLSAIGQLKGTDILKFPKDLSITSPSSNWFAMAGISVAESVSSFNPIAEVTSGIQRRWKSLDEVDNTKELLEKTGKGQIGFLHENLKRNTYVGNFGIDVEERTKIVGDFGFKYQYYTPKNLYDLNDKYPTNNEGYVPKLFKSNMSVTTNDDIDVIINDNIVWGLNSNDLITSHKSILYHTNRLLSKYNNTISINQTNKIIGKNFHDGISRGSGLYVAPNKLDGKFENTYYKENNPEEWDNKIDGIRVHTIIDQYTGEIEDGKNEPRKLIRYVGNKAYWKDGSPNVDSVIYNTVLPKIHPTKSNEKRDKIKDRNRNLMLSIENLAISVTDAGEFGLMDDEYGTPVHWSEIGPNGGRLMWFPPYNLSFNETSTANYESTVMVGRGEPMYNYMNTERGMNLSFTILIDHPQHLKDIASKVDNSEQMNLRANQFFAFGGDKLAIKENFEEISNPTNTSDVVNDTPPTAPQEITIYFPNRSPINDNEVINYFDTLYLSGYGVSDNIDNIKIPTHSGNVSDYNIKNIGNINHDVFYKLSQKIKEDKTITIDIDDYTSKNYSQYEIYNNNLTELDKSLIKFKDNSYQKHYKIIIDSGASKHGSSVENKELSRRRAIVLEDLIKRKLTGFGVNLDLVTIEIPNPDIGDTKAVEVSDKDINNQTVIENRYGKIGFELIPNGTITQTPTTSKIEKTINFGSDMMNERTIPFMSKFEAFKKKQYYPAFNTQTPEDFHKRLTFLHQCTRQGNSKISKTDNDLKARNSVFGRQPICVIRIGDFFYSKVIVETLTIDYEESTWDLNPEGLGVQPMLANINLQLKVIGGQSLSGPIDSLQNATSMNYYANSSFRKDNEFLLPYTMGKIEEYYKENKTDDIKNIINELTERNNKFKKIYEETQKK